jgi:hypothetical protein
LMGAFTIVLIFELWPAPLPNNLAVHSKYLDVLHSLPASGVLDNAAVSEPAQLYDQTITEQPMVLGYIARTPQSVANKDTQLVNSLDRPEGYSQLCSVYKVRYYTTPTSRPLKDPVFPIIYQDKQAIIYDLKNSPNC